MIAARGKSTLAFLLLTVLAVGGCKGTAPGVRNADGSITNADGSVTYPAGTTPAAPVQVATRNADGSTTNPDGSVTYPAGIRPPGRGYNSNQNANTRSEERRENGSGREPVRDERTNQPQVARVVASGTPVAVTITETLSASRNNVGDSFSGSLAQPLTGEGGAVVFPRGTQVAGVVAASKGRGRFKGAGDLAIELTSIGGTRVSATEYEAVGKGRGRRSAEVTGGGAGLGALIGGLAGGGKGALIGGLAGAGAGAAGAAYTGNRDVVIPSESSVTFTLTAPISR